MKPDSSGGEALVCAPVGKDGNILFAMASQALIPARLCRNLSDLASRVSSSTLLLLLTEESLRSSEAALLNAALRKQEAWSDLPIIVLTDSTGTLAHKFLALVGDVTTVSILERPTRVPTLLSMLRVGLAARRRQFQVRDLLLREKDAAENLHQALVDLQKAEQTNRLFAAIVSSSEDAIVSKTTDGVITSWNAGAERLFGYSSREAVGQSITLIIPPDRLDEEPRILGRIRRGDPVCSFETVRMRKDRSLVDISLTVSPVRGAAGTIIGASKVARDITEQKRAQRALRESERRLRELNQRLESEVRARTGELEQRNAEVLRQSDELRDLTVRLITTQDDERRFIARELHDSAGQTIALLSMNLGMLSREASAAPDLMQHISDLQKLARDLSREIRTASYLLHPPLLDEAGLPVALEGYVRGLMERGGPTVKLAIDRSLGRFSSDMERLIFRIVQECLTNAIRHSGTKRADIQIQRDDHKIFIAVRDYGKGIPSERLEEIRSKGSGVGIRGMRERIRPFGGEMEIQNSEPGLEVRIAIPVPPAC